MSKDRDKLMKVVKELPYVDIQEHNLFSSRNTLAEAQEYLNKNRFPAV